MANRTILVDNNTWNNTHISRVGQAMASSEEKAYEIMRELDVDYVLVIFGGLTGYSSDDINKFLWMVRIGGSTDRGAHIKENDYYAASGDFRVDKEGSPTLLNCLMYKMCYYRFGQVCIYATCGPVIIHFYMEEGRGESRPTPPSSRIILPTPLSMTTLQNALIFVPKQRSSRLL